MWYRNNSFLAEGKEDPRAVGQRLGLTLIKFLPHIDKIFACKYEKAGV